MILVDLPGFGQSSGRDLNQASWKRHAPEIIVAILSSFHIEKPVNVIATCGILLAFIFFLLYNC